MCQILGSHLTLSISYNKQTEVQRRVSDKTKYQYYDNKSVRIMNTYKEMKKIQKNESH